ncbi:MAG: hypothetical protein ABIQ11_01305 [Saprospiraceae bacterium]
MIRPILSYALTSLILLSQTGLPLHWHYCKGIMESVSILLTAECDEHEEGVVQDTCCKDLSAGSCTSQNTDCCDDEVTVLLQEFDSLLPHFDNWDQAPTLAITGNAKVIFTDYEMASNLPEGQNGDSGPPIYILFRSLIFYA